jgi:hypothetical protein
MLLGIGFEPDLEPIRRLVLNFLAARTDRAATLHQIRECANAHTIFKKSHVTVALERLRDRRLITTTSQQC